MPKLDLTRAKQIKGPMGEIRSLKGQGFSWTEAAFSPLSLFSAGEQGVWYDPSDLTTLYQDHLGSIPAAYGSPVGLMLDKSKGLVLGPELATGWTLTGTASVNGDLIEANSASYEDFAYAPLTGMVGKIVRITATVTRTSGTMTIFVGGGSYITRVNTPSAQVNVLRDVVTEATPRIRLRSEGGFVGTVKISVREIPGNHASQPTGTARPTLMQDAGGRAYLQFDGVDDRLDTAAIAGFGAPYFAAAGVQALAFTGSAGYPTILGAAGGTTDLADIGARLSGGAVGIGGSRVRVAGGTLTTSATTGNNLLTDTKPHIISGGFQSDEVFTRGDSVSGTKMARTHTHGTFTGSIRVGQGANGASTLNFFGGVYRLGNDMTEARMKQVEDFLKLKAGMAA